MGLTDPNDYTKFSLDVLLQVTFMNSNLLFPSYIEFCLYIGWNAQSVLLQTTFVNSIDAPSLALLVPIVHRGLRARSADTKKKAAQIVGNMCSLVTEPKDMIPYIGLLLPEVKKVNSMDFCISCFPLEPLLIFHVPKNRCLWIQFRKFVQWQQEPLDHLYVVWVKKTSQILFYGC